MRLEMERRGQVAVTPPGWTEGRACARTSEGSLDKEGEEREGAVGQCLCGVPGCLGQGKNRAAFWEEYIGWTGVDHSEGREIQPSLKHFLGV